MRLFFWRYVVPAGAYYTENPPYFEQQLELDRFSGVVWSESYQHPGSFVAITKATPELIAFFWDLDILVTRADTNRAMLVESMEVISKEDGDYIQISGRSAESYPSRRIIMQREPVTMNGAAAILYYLHENLDDYWYFHSDDDHPHGVSAPSSRRFFNLFKPGSVVILPDTISAEPFGQNLGDFIEEVCVGCDFGFMVEFDGEDLIYSCYQGLDRTLNQSERMPVVFSEDFKNIGYSRYVRSLENFASHVVSGGSGTGTGRQYGDAYAGFRNAHNIGGNMVERFVQAVGVSDGSLSAVAKNAVAASRKTSEFEANAVSGGAFQYRRDYQLGDKVTVVNKFGISGTAVVVQVDESEDENGLQIIPTLGYFDADEYFAPQKPEITYRFVEYIENNDYDSHGVSAYLETDIVPDYQIKLELDMQLTRHSGGDKFIFGYYGNPSYCIVLDSNGAWLEAYFYDGNEWESGYHAKIRSYTILGQRITAVLDRDQCAWGADTVAYTYAISKDPPSDGFVFWGCRNSYSGFVNLLNCRYRVYGAVFSKNGAVLHRLKPAERSTDGKLGLFDEITSTFYEGTGSFYKGDYVQ